MRAFVPFLACAGKTASQTSRSWTVHSVSAFRPYSSRPSCDGWDKSSEWTILACPVNCCMESLRALQEHFSGGASSWKNLRLQTVTEVNGAHRPPLFPPVSRTTALTDSWQQPMNDAKEHSLLISQKRSSNAPTATHNSALPVWVCRDTRASMDDHTTRSPQHTVFFAQDGQPPNKYV